MARIKANGIELEYDEIGPEDGEPVVLVMGFGAQMTKWPDAFRQGLADAGYRVIRFDNRDIGLSHQFDDKGMPNIPAIRAATAAGTDASQLPSYILDDMVDDVAGLIEALGLG
ncbi:MAG: alpha/beta hydrolase, partial [Henriciella sp.]|nr:alpha/beta hydrolase [Henriciella sp.]